MSKDQDLEKLEAVLNHQFTSREMLRRALTHSSHAQNATEEAGTWAGPDNEQLEFLGDAILGFLASEALLQRFPRLHEGELSKIKANLVSARRLLRVAQALDLGAYLTLGRGEEKTGGRTKPALLADAVEAVIAALYLDGGIPAARAFVDRFLLTELDQASVEQLLIADHKSALQEFLHARHRPSADYALVAAEGPEHRKQFTVEVQVGGRTLARATASTKKAAEQEAARAALATLDREETTVP